MTPKEAFDALGETYVDITYDGNTYIIRGEGARDMRDGAALRRLREALPTERMSVAVVGPVTHRSPDSRWTQVLWSARVVDGSFVVMGFDGATIAEAADRCREALG